MKEFIALILIALAVCSCSTTERVQTYSKASVAQQMEFHKTLNGYQLPAASIEPQACPTPVQRNIITAAGTIGKQLGLIVDGRLAEDGKLILGKRVENRQILLGVQFEFQPDGQYTYSYVTKADGSDFSECQHLKNDYMLAFSKTQK